MADALLAFCFGTIGYACVHDILWLTLHATFTSLWKFTIVIAKYCVADPFADSILTRTSTLIPLRYNGCLHLFGGYNGSRWLNDFHEYNLSTGTWRKMNAVGTLPIARFGYVAAVYKNLFKLYGGYDGSGWLDDMYGACCNAPLPSSSFAHNMKSCLIHPGVHAH